MSIESIRERVEAATPGPWTADGDLIEGVDRSGKRERDHLAQVYDRYGDLPFIAHARTDIPALLAVAEAAATVAPFLLAMHKSLGELYVNPGVIGDAQRLRDALAALKALP